MTSLAICSASGAFETFAPDSTIVLRYWWPRGLRSSSLNHPTQLSIVGDRAFAVVTAPLPMTLTLPRTVIHPGIVTLPSTILCLEWTTVPCHVCTIPSDEFSAIISRPNFSAVALSTFCTACVVTCVVLHGHFKHLRFLLTFRFVSHWIVRCKISGNDWCSKYSVAVIIVRLRHSC